MDNFIPGVYNYCNGFCPACSFQDRCMVFAETRKLNMGKGMPDPESHLFEQYLKDVLLPVVNKVDQMIKELDTLPATVDGLNEEEMNELECRRRYWADKHVLMLRYDEYCNTVQSFLEKDLPVKQYFQELQQQVRIGIEQPEQAQQRLQRMQAAMAQLYWNHELIRVKLYRALMGKQQDTHADPHFPNDSDGSAKVALISVESTMYAWKKVYEMLPPLEDVALTALAVLERLTQEIQQHFPQAMAFKRPGFDDE